MKSMNGCSRTRRRRCCHQNDDVASYHKDVDNSLSFCQQQQRQQYQKQTNSSMITILVFILSMLTNTKLLFVHSFPIISKPIIPTSHHRIIITSQNTNHVWTTNNRRRTTTTKTSSLSKRSSTQLYMFYDVPEGFYTVTFFTLGILLNISKNFARIRMEENAWEQRLADSRLDKILKSDGTLTELDEAAYEYSAYGNNNKNKKYDDDDNRDDDFIRERQSRKKKKVQVIDRDDDVIDDIDEEEDDLNNNNNNNNQSYRPMNDNEILFFEKQYRIEYDPYYDEPYTIDELPNDIGKYKIDKLYGDYIYENGEIFYKDTSYTPTIYWRQGSKPNSQRNTSSTSSPIRFFPWMKK